MATPKKQPIFLSRPKDESLQAYKDWIMEMYTRLTGKPAASETTDEEWEKNWREFWNKPQGKESSVS